MITKREDESPTQFTMRRIIDEVVQRCATIALECRSNHNKDWDRACVAIAQEIREQGNSL